MVASEYAVRNEIDLGLGRMFRILCALRHPERNFKVIHVAGTNGKGSTCQYLAKGLSSSTIFGY
jgi:dihydrofolate synthase/folylpolyglutamate synthase